MKTTFMPTFLNPDEIPSNPEALNAGESPQEGVYQSSKWPRVREETHTQKLTPAGSEDAPRATRITSEAGHGDYPGE